MKVVFATDDKETISRMTGRAKWFAFYTLEDGEVKNVEYVENDHKHDHEHEHSHSHNHHHVHGEGHHHNHNEGSENGNANGKGRNAHSGHSHKKILTDIADREALFITRHLGKHFKEGVTELGINYKMTKTETIEQAIKELS